MKFNGYCVALSLLFVFGCSKSPEEGSVPLPIVELETFEVSTTTVPTEVMFDGVIEAVNQSTVSAQTSGRIEELPFDVGDYVEKGKLIARLTDTEQRANVESAEANLQLAQVRFEDAEKQYKRVNDIYEKGLVARADYDHAKTQYRAALASLDAAKSSLTQAKEGLAYTVIKAPYSGILVSRAKDIGEMVAPGTEIMTGLSLEHLRAVVEIPQQHIGPLRQYKQARVLLPSGKSIEGEQLRIPPGADPSTHTFRILLTLPQGDHGVFPGTLVKVAFVTGEEEHLTVPQESLAYRGEVTGIYVVDEQGKIEFRYLRVGSSDIGKRAVVLAGLVSGEHVARDPVAAANVYRQRFEASENAHNE